MAQLEPAAKDWPHVDDWEKATLPLPTKPMLAMLSAAVPPLVSVNT